MTLTLTFSLYRHTTENIIYLRILNVFQEALNKLADTLTRGINVFLTSHLMNPCSIFLSFTASYRGRIVSTF